MIEHASFFLIIACFFGLWMTWGVGANDLANVMSTTLGSKAITPKQAIIIAIIFEFAGAFFGGSGVTETMQTGIINVNSLLPTPMILICGMLSVLMACTVWINLASYWGLPVSITNAIVGSMVGFGALVLGVDAVQWQHVKYIAMSWVSTPIISGVVAYILFSSIQSLILSTADPVFYARRYLPYYLFLIGFILSGITLIKALHHYNHLMDVKTDFIVSTLSGLTVALVGILVIRRFPKRLLLRRSQRFIVVEKMFALLMAFTSCAMVFAHGSNDVAVAVGPISVILEVLEQKEASHLALTQPYWVIFLGAFGVISGMLMYGRKVIETVGHGITTLTPSRAFAATLAAASAVVVSTSFGIPVSATQALVGGVLGVGLARGIGALNLVVIRNIFTSWIITIPAASLLTIVFFTLLRWIVTYP